jgi:hypothetical protein
MSMPASAPGAIAAPRARSLVLRLSVLALAALVACGGGQDTSLMNTAVEEDLAQADTAPVNDGRLHALATSEQRAAAARAAAPGFIPTGDPNAQTMGTFGPVLPWPLMPIHQVLLPDGRVLFYGSDTTGVQGGGLHYAVWDPTLGTGDDAFMILPTTTGSNIFCAGQTLLPDTGEVLIVGGTVIDNGVRGIGMNDSNVFSPSANAITAQSPMNWRRWYPSAISLPDNTQLVLGGRIDPDTSGGEDVVAPRRAAPLPDTASSSPATYATMPEVWSSATGWRQLPAADNADVFGATNQGWYYPRAWVMPGGKVFILGNSGSMYQLDTAGDGVLTKLNGTAGKTTPRLQSVMYQPGKILTLRNNLSAKLIDINGAQPVVTTAAPTTRIRQFGNATLLADGQVWLNGGSTDGNEATNDFFVSEIWNPATGLWTDMATAAIARLYHSSSILLPDATVATGGGGDPGPFRNLNAEIYYPPYLYLKDGTGTPAPRPAITSAPDTLTWAQKFQVVVSSSTPISRVTLIRTGVITHVFNTNQRFQEMNFTQKGNKVTLKTPASTGIAPPGYYMLFVFDGNGVPSIAKIFRLG